MQEIVWYKLYAIVRHFHTVGEAVLSKQPCLTEKGSLSEYAGNLKGQTGNPPHAPKQAWLS